MEPFSNRRGFPIVFTEASDTREVKGRVRFVYNALEPVKGLSPPPGTGQWLSGAKIGSLGRFVLGAFEGDSGGYEIFVNESIARNEPQTLVRYETNDFFTYTEPELVLKFEGPVRWLGHKSMAKRPDTGERLLLAWAHGETGGLAAHFFKSVNGSGWEHLNGGRPCFIDHDCGGLLWVEESGKYVDLQNTYQHWEREFGDNIPTGIRRVLSVRVSEDGLNWVPEYPVLKEGPHRPEAEMLTPDEDDPPDLEFYCLGAFRYADRYVGLMTPYTATPLGGVVDTSHGPWLAARWWFSPNPADVKAWRRPARDFHAAPIEFVTLRRHHQPLHHGDQLLWLQGGKVYGIPSYRICGVWAETNAAFSTRSFEASASPMTLNASIPSFADRSISNPLVPQPFVMAEVLDGEGDCVSGFEKEKCILKAVDDVRVPLRWEGRDTSQLQGETVSVRLYLHHATVYAVDVAG
jgi:hypothetical protein